jgi:tetratricopeptide (TPR) repeat protein
MPEVLNKEKLLEQAKLLADQGKLDRAVQEYKKVLQMDPKDLRLKLRVAELYVKLKKINDAIQTYQEVATSYCDDAFYLKAVTVYKNILRLNPSLLDVNQKLADLYEKMGLVSDAIHQYQIVANMLEQKGMDKEVMEVRKQIVAIAPDTPAHRVRLAEAYQLCGEEDAAMNEYEVLVKQLSQSGTPEQLIELYEKILAHRPDNLEMVRALCATYVKVGEWKKALKRMEASYNLVMQDPELLTQMAEFYARQNQLATASEKYRDLAELYVSRQEVSGAVKAYAAAVVYMPEEEAHVKELVGQWDPGSVDGFVKAVEARREWLAKSEAEAEAAEVARVEVEAAAKVSGVSTASAPVKGESSALPPKVTVVDVKGQLRQIDAALQLAETYSQMGLKDEAQEELQKAKTAYELCVKANAADPVIQSRIEAMQTRISAAGAPTAGVPTAGAPVVSAPIATAPKAPPRVIPSAGTRTTGGGAKPDPKGPAPKKRISFV